MFCIKSGTSMSSTYLNILLSHSTYTPHETFSTLSLSTGVSITLLTALWLFWPFFFPVRAILIYIVVVVTVNSKRSMYRVIQKKWHRETCPLYLAAVQQYTLKYIIRKHTLIPLPYKRKIIYICSTLFFIDMFVPLSKSLG